MDFIQLDLRHIAEPELNWQPIETTLNQLVPWEHNPKTISKSHAKRLLKLWDELGQFQTIAIGPAGEVYDGHQRLSVLLAAHGPAYSVKALQAERALTEEERAELVIAAHVGTVGQFDWQKLSGWDTATLTQWGMDAETLQGWNSDAANLREMMNAAGEPLDMQEAWQGMPEFEQNDLSAFRTIKVHFDSQDSVDDFSRLINQTFTDKTISIWHPFKPQENLKDFEYRNES